MQYYVNGHEADKSKLISKMEDMKVKFEKQWNNLQSKNEDLQHLLGWYINTHILGQNPEKKCNLAVNKDIYIYL